ncbi:MAG: DUF2194 domain-containing protein, partial [Hyphomicrobiales bacterium]
MRYWLEFLRTKVQGLGALNERPKLLEFLVIIHSEDQHGIKVMENVCASFAQAKMQFTVLDLASQNSWPNLDAYMGIVLCTERIKQINAVQALEIEKYVHNGGGLLVAYRSWNRSLENIFGFSSPSEFLEVLSPGSSGFDFCTELFPGLSELRITDNDWHFNHYQLDLNQKDLNADCEVLITDIEKRPIAWFHRPGAGRVVYWNTGILSSRLLRGFVLQTALLILPLGVSSIVGVGLIHVDDFPPALSDLETEPISTEFPGMTHNEFYYDIWLPDMMALKEHYGLKYTFYTIMDYVDNDTTQPAKLNVEYDRTLSKELKQRF